MVRLEGPYLPSVVVRNNLNLENHREGDAAGDDEVNDAVASVADDEKVSERQIKEAWVACRSIRNEILLELHQGPFVSKNASTGRFYRCVVEGCKVRDRADLTISELGYVLYGDVVEVVESTITPDGVVFLKLHDRYFDGAAWVVERSLDNESVLNEVEGPWFSLPAVPKQETYRCVQDSGAPVRMEPELTAPPVGRIPCGALVTVVERAITDQRQVFLRIVDFDALANDIGAESNLWVIETSTCCSSVMIKANIS
ncbi:unnamed protein product [Phytophthora lilii]|uniref:Unnamed protein product n=1 Tax=Phytophthora lilii TaxID=2077276 RepID=A0A9W6WPM1_9STRA|nr:unnamed protein product [Phytophthora lilii]